MKTCSGCGRLNPDVAASCQCGTRLAATPDQPVRANDAPVATSAGGAAAVAIGMGAMSRPAAASPPRASATGIAAAPRATAARASPTRPAAQASPDAAMTDGFDEEAWRTVIGPKSQDWYLDRFRAIQADGGGWRMGWHWPAFFLTFFWLLYRRMWGWAIVWFVVVAYLGSVVLLTLATVSPVAALALLAARFVVPALFATSLYHRRCERLVDRLGDGVSRERYLGRLEARGGTGRTAMIVCLALGAFFLVGILAAVALPAYQDYTLRAKVSEAAHFGRAQTAYAGEAFARTGQFPFVLQSRPDQLTVLEGAAIDPGTGMIELRVRPTAKGAIGSILYTPDTRPSQPLTWSCQVTAPLAKFERYACPPDASR